jgi:hypothetical protein
MLIPIEAVAGLIVRRILKNTVRPVMDQPFALVLKVVYAAVLVIPSPTCRMERATVFAVRRRTLIARRGRIQPA